MENMDRQQEFNNNSLEMEKIEKVFQSLSTELAEGLSAILTIGGAGTFIYETGKNITPLIFGGSLGNIQTDAPIALVGIASLLAGIGINIYLGSLETKYEELHFRNSMINPSGFYKEIEYNNDEICKLFEEELLNEITEEDNKFYEQKPKTLKKEFNSLNRKTN